MTPHPAFELRAKAMPRKLATAARGSCGSAMTKVDKDGSVTLRYKSRLHHIGMGRGLKGIRVILLVAGRQIPS